jgi:hypothetical protein
MCGIMTGKIGAMMVRLTTISIMALSTMTFSTEIKNAILIPNIEIKPRERILKN